MPDLGGGPKRRQLDLSGVPTGKNDDAETPKASKAAKSSRPPGGSGSRRNVMTGTGKVTKATARDYDDDDGDTGDEEDDEIIQSSLKSGGEKFYQNKMFIWCACGVAAVIVVILFLLMNGGRKDPAPVDTTPPSTSSEQPSAAPTDSFGDPNLGIQDFTQNTNNTSNSPLSNPDGFIEDINGLTTRVEYNVSAIQNAIDFVNYTKYRGTWGGGLELYWLDCTYKGAHYVIQIPFKYYKELDDTGIVPVQMEVLYSKQQTGETVTIISYMCLDEKVLQTVLKSAK